MTFLQLKSWSVKLTVCIGQWEHFKWFLRLFNDAIYTCVYLYSISYDAKVVSGDTDLEGGGRGLRNDAISAFRWTGRDAQTDD
jgi:hypothetical protein